MPTLTELLAIVTREADRAGVSLDPRRLEAELRTRFPTERIYIPPANSPRDPARKQRIVRDCARLPVRVVAERHGVTPQYVYRLVKRQGTG